MRASTMRVSLSGASIYNNYRAKVGAINKMQVNLLGTSIQSTTMISGSFDGATGSNGPKVVQVEKYNAKRLYYICKTGHNPINSIAGNNPITSLKKKYKTYGYEK
jgi:hypothetical protein